MSRKGVLTQSLMAATEEEANLEASKIALDHRMKVLRVRLELGTRVGGAPNFVWTIDPAAQVMTCYFPWSAPRTGWVVDMIPGAASL